MYPILSKTQSPLPILLVCTLLISVLPAEILFKPVGMDNGISRRAVSCILQDPTGFMWFGSEEGLFRYDGYNFVQFKNDPENPASLSDNLVQCLAVDSCGNLWIGTNNGLNRMSLHKPGVFEVFRHDSLNSHSLVDNDIRTLMIDQEHILWIGTYNNGISRLHPDSLAAGRFNNLPYREGQPESPIHPGITALAQDAAGRIWAGTYGAGLSMYLPGRKHFQPVRLKITSGEQPRVQYITQIIPEKDQLLLATYKSGFLKAVLPAGGRTGNRILPAEVYRKFSENPAISTIPSIYAVLREPGSSTLLIATGQSGLYRFHPNGKKFTHYTKNDKPGGLISNRVLSLYRDRSGIIWVGTNDGLCTYNPNVGELLHLNHIPGDSLSLSQKNITALRFHRSFLWIGTDGGLDRYDMKTGRIENYPITGEKPGQISSRHISDLYHDEQGNLWVGTFGSGLWRGRQQRTGRYYFTPFTDVEDQMPRNLRRFITCMIEDRHHRFWIGSLAGMFVIEKKTDRQQYQLNTSLLPDVAAYGQVTNLLEDRHGNIWVSSYGKGVFRLKIKGDSLAGVRQYRHSPGKAQSLSNDKVLCIEEDRSGNIWIATAAGLNRLDVNRDSVQTYTEKDGLCNDFIYSIVVDHTGDLWLGTNNGLSCCHRGSDGGYQFRNFYRQDGLQENEYNVNAYHISREGWLAFGGVNGVSLFKPDAFHLNELPPPVVLTNFLVFNQPMTLDSAIYKIRRIKLPYRENFFAFEFSALDYTAPEKNRYAYQMAGFDPDWIESGSRRYASYTNLDPGEYIFRVRGSNNDGVWSESASLRVIIEPPFWQTWWFRLLAIMLVVSLLWGLHRFRLNRLLAIERLRVRIASDLHDDIGSTLTKISMFSDLVRHQPDSPESISLVEKIGMMSRELVTTLGDVVWSIDARNDTVGGLLDRMTDFAAEMLSPRNITFTFETEGMDAEHPLAAHQRQNIYLIFKEALTNVVRHSGADRVEVYLRNDKSQFVMAIRDNGSGLDAESGLSGHGMRNMRLRAGRIGGKLEIVDSDGVTIRLSTPAW